MVHKGALADNQAEDEKSQAPPDEGGTQQSHFVDTRIVPCHDVDTPVPSAGLAASGLSEGRPCPTLSRIAGSAWAPSQTVASRHVSVISVIPLKADIHQREWHVRFVPEADACFLTRPVSFSGRPLRQLIRR